MNEAIDVKILKDFTMLGKHRKTRETPVSLYVYVYLHLVDCLLSRSVVSHSCDHMDPPGSFVYGISQARILAWIAISSSRGSSRPRD